jgi:hypothetical protein
MLYWRVRNDEMRKLEVEGSHADTVEQRFSTGVPREFGERSKGSKKKFRNKKNH